MKTTRIRPFFKTLVGTLYFGFTVGVMTGISITFFKFAASWAIKSSATIYGFLSAKPYFLPVALAAIFGLSFLCDTDRRCDSSRNYRFQMGAQPFCRTFFLVAHFCNRRSPRKRRTLRTGGSRPLARNRICFGQDIRRLEQIRDDGRCGFGVCRCNRRTRCRNSVCGRRSASQIFARGNRRNAVFGSVCSRLFSALKPNFSPSCRPEFSPRRRYGFRS